MGLAAYGEILPPYVSLTTNSSIYGITGKAEQIGFGLIDSVNVYHNLSNPGDNCMFKKTDAMLITCYGTQYWIIDESNLLYKENIIP